MSKQKGENPIYIIPEDARMANITEENKSVLNGTTAFQHRILEIENRQLEQVVPSESVDFMSALGIKYVYSNPNVHQQKLSFVNIDSNDCSICAISNLFNITWGEAFKMLSNIARQYGLPINHAVTQNKVLSDNNYEKIYDARFDEYYPYFHFKLVDILTDPAWQTGNYFITIDYPTPHSTVIKNGKLYDIFKFPHLDYQYPFVIFGRVTAVYTEISNAKEFYEYNTLEAKDGK